MLNNNEIELQVGICEVEETKVSEEIEFELSANDFRNCCGRG